ncbi:MAG: extracellular solute-binding protein [Anaerolineales bacterium]|nr:extracellular solute-binding protein [Anaerolineales bacterium]
MRRLVLTVFFPLLTVFLAACDLLNNVSNVPAEATAVSATPAVALTLTPAVQSTPNFVIAATITPTDNSLIIWLPPAIASRTEAGAVTLSDQLLAFNNVHPDLEIIVEQKPTTGQGGALNYLRTGRGVAPGVLPDLIALPVTQLAAAANEGLVFPMEEFLDPAAVDDLFPPARAWAYNADHLVGYPFALTDMLHLEYSNTITEPVALTWASFISDTTRHMVLPAAGPDGGRLALEFYLAAGGNLTNEAGQPILELDPLTTALEQLYDGRANGFILQQSSNITNLADGVRLVRDGSTDYALTSSDVFLQSTTTDYTPQFAAVPGLDQPLPALVNGWAWATTTPDAGRKALAAELITFLTTPENLGSWSRQSQILPTTPGAFSAWPNDDVYAAFAQNELQRAIPMPLTASSTIMAALDNAVFDVISLNKSPAVAAAEAVAAVGS